MGLDIKLVKATEDSPVVDAEWDNAFEERWTGQRRFSYACSDFSESWNVGGYGDMDFYYRITDHTGISEWVKSSGEIPEVNQKHFLDLIELMRNDRTLWLFFSN